MKRVILLTLLATASPMFAAENKTGSERLPVYQATGLKICEVDAQSAIIWTRLAREITRMFHGVTQPSENLPLMN